MRKTTCMVAGVIIGSSAACLLNNSKKTLNTLVNCGDTLLKQVNDKFEQLALMIENIDEDKLRRQYKTKYNNLKRQIKNIDFKKLTDEARATVKAVLLEINKLVGDRREIES